MVARAISCVTCRFLSSSLRAYFLWLYGRLRAWFAELLCSARFCLPGVWCVLLGIDVGPGVLSSLVGSQAGEVLD